MKITYYGHSCFLVEEKDSRILFDPYEDGSVPGFTLPKDLPNFDGESPNSNGEHLWGVSHRKN